jgi:RimJ/RimL family protein N-acetyltransferase
MIELCEVDRVDPAQWAAWSADADVRRFLEIRHSDPETTENAARWLASLDPLSAFSVIVDDSCAGVAWARWADHEAHGVRTMTVLLRSKQFWNRGVATEVSLRLIDMFPCRKWVRFTYGSNVRMQRVMQKSGFALVAELPDYHEFEGGFTSRQIWMRDGRPAGQI